MHSETTLPGYGKRASHRECLPPSPPLHAFASAPEAHKAPEAYRKCLHDSRSVTETVTNLPPGVPRVGFLGGIPPMSQPPTEPPDQPAATLADVARSQKKPRASPVPA